MTADLRTVAPILVCRGTIVGRVAASVTMESHAWREAQELATAVLGENSRLFPAQCGSYSGVIIGVTDQYVLQRITWRSAVAHDKEVLDRFPTVGERVRVRYQGDAGRIERIQG